MKTDDRPEGEQEQMPEWMRDGLGACGYTEYEILHSGDILVVLNTTDDLTRLHDAGLLLTREQKRDIDAIKRALPSIAEYENANITSVICRLTSEENVILRQRLNKAARELARLKAENGGFRVLLGKIYGDLRLVGGWDGTVAKIKNALGADDEK